MKKKYIIPEQEVVTVQNWCPLLAGSGEVESIDSGLESEDQLGIQPPSSDPVDDDYWGR